MRLLINLQGVHNYLDESLMECLSMNCNFEEHVSFVKLKSDKLHHQIKSLCSFPDKLSLIELRSVTKLRLFPVNVCVCVGGSLRI